MNRRNKRTSYYQYEVYLDFMEENPLMSGNKLSRTQDGKKWKELSDLLNKCPTGPTMSPEEWRKRLNDWKNSTRSKYRRSINSDDKSNAMTPLENRALQIFSLEPNFREVSMRLQDMMEEEEEQDKEIVEENENMEEFFEEEDEEEQYQQFIAEPHEQANPTVINGHSAAKKLRLDGASEIIYEVSDVTSEQSAAKEPSAFYSEKIQEQLKRISDIHEASLHFKIARFQYKNPGFEFVPEL
ncbi:histone acetyltransferase KAT6B [Drosophila sechellia]|uniref:Regulatory protein zeste n=1 Tax=Drosophila sechellia TaxID=7238 RepID=B4HP41_DROSE|nr:histone acetyltransferase KAT6B [Drosophila sechellia]EDW48543.1 GM19857 [Drosophila sechellia]